MNSKREKAMALFQEGYNCAQSVFAAYAEDYGIPTQQALRLASSFGGGIGRMRDTCGAFSGAIMVIGLETGAIDGADTAGKQQNYKAVQQLAKRFRAQNGSLLCRDLLGLSADGDYSDPKPERRTADYYANRPCLELVGNTCDLLDSFLNMLHQ